MDKFSVAFGVW